jgi:hypothetical protein
VPVTRVRPEARPTESVLRARAVKALAEEVRERGLAGRQLRAYAYLVRANLGTDAAIDLLLKLIEKRPSG